MRCIALNDTAKQGKPRIDSFGTDKLGFAVSRANIAASTVVHLQD